MKPLSSRQKLIQAEIEAVRCLGCDVTWVAGGGAQ